MNVDDPKFTAYALDCLPEDEKDVVESQVLADKELWGEAELTAAFAEKLKNAFTVETNARLSAAHWREIFAEAGIEQPEPEGIPMEPEKPSRFPVWALPAAAGVTVGAVIASLAITWGDKVALIADSPTRHVPAIESRAVVQPVIHPESSVAVVRKAEPARAVAASKPLSVPRPTQAPVLAGSATPNRNVTALVSANLAGSTDDAGKTEEIEEVESLPLPELINPFPEPAMSEAVAIAPAAEPAGVDEPDDSALARTNSPVPAMPVFAAARSGNRTEVPKPVASITSPVAAAPKPPVAAITVASNVHVPKVAQPAAMWTQPQPKPAAIGPVAWVRSGKAVPDSSARSSGVGTMMVMGADKISIQDLRFGTLEEAQSLLVYDGIAGGSAFSDKSLPFSFRAAPDMKVNLTLDNGGLPIEVTPGSTRIIDVSEPYVVPVNP